MGRAEMMSTFMEVERCQRFRRSEVIEEFKLKQF